MRMEHRLQNLELKWIAQKPGCNITLFIVIPEGSQNGHFDSDSYRPSDDAIENYLKHLKQSGQCRGCKGSCAIDWSPDEFTNHTLGGARSPSSPEPKVFTMFCVDAETPVLCRRLMSGEREPR